MKIEICNLNDISRAEIDLRPLTIFISQEKVSVYLVEDGKVKNVLDPEGIIDWKTFSDVTTLVERIHFELLGAYS